MSLSSVLLCSSSGLLLATNVHSIVGQIPPLEGSSINLDNGLNPTPSSAARRRIQPAMGSRLGRRVLHFANLPIKLMLPPAPLASVQEFAIKTVPSASKIDIRRCLESMYGFSIAEVRTLNMEGKKLRRGRFLAAKPDYKKAYVTLHAPLHVSPDIFPIGAILAERERKASAAAARRKAVEGAEIDGEREGKGKHWMEDDREGFSRAGHGKVVYGNPGRLGKKRRGRARVNQEPKEEGEKFPWNGMRLTTEKPARKRHYPAKKQGGIVLKQRSHRGSALRAKRSFVA